MKESFYKNRVLFLSILSAVIVFNIFVLPIAICIKELNFAVFTVLLGDFSIFLGTYTGRKLILAKIKLTRKSIDVILFKHILEQHSWDDFIDVFIIRQYNSKYIRFVKNVPLVNIDMDIDERRLIKLKEYCTNPKILEKLNRIGLTIFNQQYGPQ